MPTSTLATIEKLVAENSRIQKELQVLRTGDNVAAYTPYQDAGYALDTLKALGFCAGNTDATLTDLMKDMESKVSNMIAHNVKLEEAIKYAKVKDEAVWKTIAGQDCDEDTTMRYPVVRHISKLRGTLEMVMMRLERIEKIAPNEEINQLHFDLDKFLTQPVR
jgi:hypothetical protein